MAEGRENSEWSRTASVMCLLANIHRGKNKPAHKVEDFMPSFSASRTPPPTVPITVLKDLFIPKGKT